MADGYARASGRVGFAIVHHGPGLTNAITALTEAAKSATPLMLVTAAVGADDPWSNFATDQEALIEATGARCICLDNAGDARRATLEAVDLARTHRRPVVFVVPVDVQQEQFVEVSRGGDENPRAPTPIAPSLDDVQAIADIVVRSRRPVILAGRGASTEGARAALLALGDRTGSLHATTAGAAALFNGRPYNLGIAGGFSSPTTKRIIGRADLVLAFGASLNPWTMNHGHLLSETAHVVHVDDRAEALGRQHPVSLKIHGDAEVTATMLDRELERRRSEPAPFRAEVAEDSGELELERPPIL